MRVSGSHEVSFADALRANRDASNTSPEQLTMTDPRCTPTSPVKLRSNLSQFALGQLLTTPGAADLLNELDLSPFEFVNRHWHGDWGDIDAEDVQANLAALKYGNRILSAYDIGAGQKLWVITEADRSATTLLLPEEY